MPGMNIDLALLREELEGCLHLGMEREALRLAGKILSRHNLNASAFNSAINALLICEDRLARWLGRVESAYAALGRRDQQKSAKAMFNFYVSLNRWTEAARFLPRRPATAEGLLFSMWTLLNLRRIEEAEPLYKASIRMFRRVEDEFEQSCLLEAIGCYWAQNRDWGAAEYACQRGADCWPFAPQAWQRLVKIQAARGWQMATELSALIDQECSELEKAGLPTSGNYGTAKDLDEQKALLNRQASRLAKVVPAKERWQFGL
jgi:tetratricopeptide (TPR) repeat protein